MGRMTLETYSTHSVITDKRFSVWTRQCVRHGTWSQFGRAYKHHFEISKFSMAAKNMRNIRISCIIWLAFCWLVECDDRRQPLRFGGKTGEFRILQVADMHYADGWKTPCEDVFPQQMPSCSDLNTTAFIRRLILAERPDLIVFTGNSYSLLLHFLTC